MDKTQNQEIGAFSLINRLPVACCVFGKSGNLVDSNDRWWQLLGFEPHKKPGHFFSSLLPKLQPCGTPSTEFLIKNIQAAIDTGHARFSLSFTRPDATFGLLEIELGKGIGNAIGCAMAATPSPAHCEAIDISIFDGAPIPCILWEEDGELLMCNKAAYQLFEINTEKEIIHVFSAEIFQKTLRRTLDKGEQRFDWTHFKQNGGAVSVNIISKPITISNRRVVGLFIQDLQPLLEATIKLSEAERHNQFMLDATPMAITLYNKDMKPIFCNQEAVDMFGANSKEEYLENFENMLFSPGPEAAQPMGELKGYISRAFEEGIMKQEFVGIKFNGSPIFIEATWVRLNYQNEFSVAEYMRDVTEVKSAQEEKQAAESRTRFILDTAPMAITLYNRDLKPIYCNQEAMDMFGANSKEEYLQNFEDIINSRRFYSHEAANELRENVAGAFTDGFVRKEWLGEKLDGTPIYTDATWMRLDYQNDNVVAEYMRDLTEAKIAEAKINEANQAARLIADTSPILVEFYDEDGNLTYCNEKVRELFRVASKDEYMLHYAKLSPEIQPDGAISAAKSREMVQQALDDGYVRFEWMRQTVTGEALPMDVVHLRAIISGKPAVISYSFDMRTVKAAIEKEKEATRLANLYLDAAPLFVEIWDENFNLQDCSQSTLDFFKAASKEEFIDKYFDLMPERQPCGANSLEMHIEKLMKALEEGEARFEFVHTSTDGEVLPVEAVFVRLEQLGKRIVVGYNRDLRDIKKAADAANEANERAQLMLNATPLACYLIKENRLGDGIVHSYGAIDCNRAALDLFSFASKDEAIARFWDTFPVYTEKGFDAFASEFNGVAMAAMESGHLRFEYNLQDIDGKAIPCELSIMRVIHKGEPALACFAFDLRQIKAMVEEMKRIEIAEEESRAKSRFLARMSHEIRTPLNAVLGITEIELQKNHHSIETEEAFYRIYNSADLLHTIINDILDLSKVEAGKMEIIPALYEFASLIVDTVQLNIMYIGSKPIDFRLEVDENLPTHFIGDEIRIKQILNNVLSNAFKYTKKGTVTLYAHAEPAKTGIKGEVDLVFSVRDTGQGMTPEQVNKLFNFDFIRFNLQNNRAIEGTGLGMSITYQLIDMMHGDIHVESDIDTGTTFTVRLPQQVGSNDCIGKEVAANLGQFESTQMVFKRRFLTERSPLPHGRVLVVDDVESNLYVARGLLMPYKIHVETASGGLEAIEIIKEGNLYDIVFMDHMMPDLDGVETTKILREMGYDRPIVALTANTLKGQDELFMSSGFSGFVSKPININQLDACLMHFIGANSDLPLLAGETPHQEKEDDSKLPKGLIDSFLRDACKSLGFLENLMGRAPSSLSHEEISMYITHVHGMKSALANVGQAKLSKLGGILEDAGRDNNMTIILAETPKFMEGLRKAARSFAQEKPVKTEVDESDPLDLKNHLLAISKACKAYNKRGAKNAIDELSAKPCSSATKALLQKISVLLLEGEFEAAEAAAAQAMGGE